jgi:hypothetical protein
VGDAMSLHAGYCHQCGEKFIATVKPSVMDICDECDIANQTEWYMDMANDWKTEQMIERRHA